MTGARSLVLGLAVAAGLGSCSKNDSLVLLDLHSSGPLGAPVARVRLSAKGWKTRVVTTDDGIGPAGFQVGYYGPGNGGAVSVTAEALDAADCVLGSGTGTVAKLAAGATSDPTTVFVRPLPANGCVPDAGTMDDGGPDTGDDGGGEDAGADAGDDTAGDASDDGAADAGTDGGDDVGADSAADAMDDAAGHATNDATNDATGDSAIDASFLDGA